jgi:hypothetical protein
MATKVRRAGYYTLPVSDKPGTGFAVLSKLKDSGINILAHTAFPTSSGQAKMTLVPEDPDAFDKAVEQSGLTLSPRKEAFYIEGDDRVGAAAESLQKLADAGINITASCGAEAGGNFGIVVWVKPDHVAAAAKALGAQN